MPWPAGYPLACGAPWPTSKPLCATWRRSSGAPPRQASARPPTGSRSSCGRWAPTRTRNPSRSTPATGSPSARRRPPRRAWRCWRCAAVAVARAWPRLPAARRRRRRSLDDISGGAQVFAPRAAQARVAQRRRESPAIRAGEHTLVFVAHHDAGHGGAVFHHSRPTRSRSAGRASSAGSGDLPAAHAAVGRRPDPHRARRAHGLAALRRRRRGIRALGTAAAMADIARAPSCPAPTTTSRRSRVLLELARRCATIRSRASASCWSRPAARSRSWRACAASSPAGRRTCRGSHALRLLEYVGVPAPVADRGRGHGCGCRLPAGDARLVAGVAQAAGIGSCGPAHRASRPTG